MNDPTTPIRPDPYLAVRMSRVYNREMESALAYTYRHLLTEGLDNEASDLFLDLAREDAAHAHTLGRLIRALGGDPGIGVRMRTPRIDLSTDASCRALPVVRRMLREAMAAEAATVTELESLAAAAREDAVLRPLRAIIAETQEQYERLEALAREVSLQSVDKGVCSFKSGVKSHNPNEL